MTDSSRWALILGASSGFGAAAAKALAAEGFDILGVHLDRRSTLPNAEAVLADIEAMGREARFFNVNAADEGKRGAVLDAATELVGDGTIGVFLHSLAFGTLVPFIDLEDDGGKTLRKRQLEMTLDVMANSLVYWTQDIVHRGLMGPGGRVFAMTSTGSHQVSPSYGAVSAAKAALEAHCRQLAFELLKREITVNSICAGVTRTAALEKIPGNEGLIRKSIEKSPINRLTTCEDVAGAVAALTDPRFHWMTGNVLGIHGGEPFIG
jgi:enoyl-[acyl-carrier protein] reductase III